MPWYFTPALLMLLHYGICFPRGKSTEKPEVPLLVNTKQRRPTHISEFTDPDTGLNPFLDLEEGPTSMGRSVMEDERRDDESNFGIDLVEGDAPDRRWNLEEPKEHWSRMPARRPEQNPKDDYELPVVTTPRVIPNPPTTTVEMFPTKDVEHNTKADFVDEDTELQRKVAKEGKESFFSHSVVIYTTATIAILTVVIVLVGVCWWGKKVKTSRSSPTAEVKN